MSHAFDTVRRFEEAIAEYCGAPLCVTTNSCTKAIQIAVEWCLRDHPYTKALYTEEPLPYSKRQAVEIPFSGYVGVPSAIKRALGRPTYRAEEWKQNGGYQLRPLPVWDYARKFTRGMYVAGEMQCVSFHASKILGTEQGGAILLDDPEAYAWLRRLRFDGRTEGVHPRDDSFTMVGEHCYLSPTTAALGHWRLHYLPKHNEVLQSQDDYPEDLSAVEVFR